ncbi:Coiled-coil and C2 domain-containing protein 1B [Cladochytrium tenue]|nr:Coiled-coil and C2 domain-containing protein 1B [Cladochytrium tenue]
MPAPQRVSQPQPSAAIKRVTASSAAVPAAPSVPIRSAPGDVDVDAIISSLPALAMGEEEDVQVELTDADMNDPELLRELSLVGGNDDVVAEESNSSSTADAPAVANESDGRPISGSNDIKADGTQNAADTVYESSQPDLPLTSTQPSRPSEPTEPAASVAVVPRDPPEAAQKPSTPPTLTLAASSAASSLTHLNEAKQRVTDFKAAALAAKRDGDTQRAREHLVAAKALQERVERAERDGLPWDPSDTPAAPSALPPARSAAAASVAVAATVAVPQAGGSQPRATSAGARAGAASARAPATARTSGAAPPPPKVADTSPRTAVVPSSAVVSGLSTAPSTPGEAFQLIRERLEAQAARSGEAAAHALRANRRDVAVDFHRRRKQFAADAALVAGLATAAAAGGAAAPPPPPFRFEAVELETERSFSDVLADELEVRVVRATDLVAPGVAGRDIESYAAFDVGWPPADSPKAAEARGQSQTVSKDPNPEYEFSKRVPIQRTRAFQRHLERRRATFDVFYRPRGWGGISLLAAAPVHIGRAAVRLDALLTSCEIHEIIDLADKNNPRRLTGGKLEVILRLRSPLMKPEVVTTRENWLVLETNPSSRTTALAASQPVSGPAVAIAVPPAEVPKEQTVAPNVEQPAQSTSPLSPTQPVAQPEVQPPMVAPVSTAIAASAGKSSPAPAPAPASSKPSVEAVDPDLEELEVKFLSPDTIVSNMVLETEHAALAKQVDAMRASGKPVSEDLEGRRSGYELRMNILVTMVQLGSLTMPDYIASVKNSIAETKRFALAFKKHGRVDLARQAMMRIKTMSDEVEEVERAMADGEL